MVTGGELAPFVFETREWASPGEAVEGEGELLLLGRPTTGHVDRQASRRCAVNPETCALTLR